MKWKTIELGEVATIVSGSTPKTGVAEYWDGEIWWATPKDLSGIDSIYLTQTAQRITDAGLKSCSSRMLPTGSVLFSSRAPIGHVAINAMPVCTNQGFKSLIPDSERLNNKFLYFWLRANRAYLDSLGNGATFKEVSKAIVEKVEIPLPPLAEQERLAAILDRADALRRLRRESLERLDELAQSLFLELFGDPATNPKGWPVVKLGQALTVTGGYAFRSDLFSELGAGIVRISNIQGGVVKLDNLAKIPLEQLGAGTRYAVEGGDVLIAMSGATTGKIGIVPTTLDGKLFLNQRVGNIKPIANKSTVRFVSALLESSFFQRWIKELAWGAAQPNISGKQIESIPIPLPPLPLQQQFATQIEELEALKTRARLSLTELDALFAALQHRAFAGEL